MPGCLLVWKERSGLYAMMIIAPVFITLAIVIAAITVSVIFWPRWGILAGIHLRRRAAARVLREDALKHLCKLEASGHRPTLESVSGALHLKSGKTGALLHEMERQGLISFDSGDLCLTGQGRSEGLQVIRAHRLWECYLADTTGIHETEWHDLAERQEHFLSPEEIRRLSARLGHPTHDPHGDPIPTSGGSLPDADAQPLNSLRPGEIATIVHIEDEPQSLYDQLVAIGLRPGILVQMQSKNEQNLQFLADGTPREVTPLQAHQIEVYPVSPGESAGTVRNLAELKPGEHARMLSLARGCRGQERRRLLDLGFVAGTDIEAEMVSPSGEPTAYRVRGTLIALHREQARLVLVESAGKAQL